MAEGTRDVGMMRPIDRIADYTAPCEVRPSQVRGAVEGLHSELGRGVELYRMVEERLGPVLPPEPPSGADALKQAPRDRMAPMAEELDTLRLGFAELNDRYMSLLQRIEL